MSKAWSHRGPSPPVLELNSYSRFNDLTFSVGRKTDLLEVNEMMIKAGCYKRGELLDYVNQMRLTGNLENGQIFVECNRPGLNDVFVDKLNGLTLSEGSIRKCHSYSNRDLLVRFSYIHSSVDVENEIVNKFLRKYGEVLDWWPVKDKDLKIPTGPYMFVMKEEDIKRNPLPESIYLNHMQVFINHRNQVKVCHNCGKAGHYRRECPSTEFPTLDQAFKSNPDQVDGKKQTPPFLQGIMPTRDDQSRPAILDFLAKPPSQKSGSSVQDSALQSTIVSDLPPSSTPSDVPSSTPSDVPPPAAVKKSDETESIPHDENDNSKPSTAAATDSSSSSMVQFGPKSNPANISSEQKGNNLETRKKLKAKSQTKLVEVTLSDFKVPTGSGLSKAKKFLVTSSPKPKRTRRVSDGHVSDGDNKKSKVLREPLINLGKDPIILQNKRNSSVDEKQNADDDGMVDSTHDGDEILNMNSGDDVCGKNGNDGNKDNLSISIDADDSDDGGDNMEWRPPEPDPPPPEQEAVE